MGITKTLGRQGIAFRGHGSDDDGNFKQIVQLVAKYCPELRHWLNTSKMRPYHVTYLSAQSQNEFIELIGHEVQRRIVQEIKDAGMYSVMADTTPDVSHKHGRTGRGAEGAAAPPVCWANKASRAIFASLFAYYKNKWDKFCQFCGNSVNFVGNMLSNRNFS